MSRGTLFTDKATLSVACPTCPARAGEPCTGDALRGASSTSAIRRRKPHAARERALRERRRELLALRDAKQGQLEL